MKRRLLHRSITAYLIFLVGSILAALFLTPVLLPEAGADVQNACHILFLVPAILSLIPLLYYYFRIYRPLSQIIQGTKQLTEQGKQPALTYEADDELGALAGSVNYLADAVNNSGESQRKFISNISHDLRSPLTSIKGYVDAILDGTIPPEFQEKYLKVVLGETKRLNKLAEELLILNNFDDRGVLLELSQFDLVAVIGNMTATFEGLSQSKNLQVRTVFPDTQVMVYADQAKIQQVLYNLLDNAIKFSYPDREILIDVRIQKKKAFVSVKDYGEGISPENLNKIWDRFYKTDASRGRDKKGTGLGLSIVREIIRAHKENIDVISTKDVGTEFVFTLTKG